VQGLKADRLKIEARSYVETVETLMGLPSHFTDKAAHTEAREALDRATYQRDRDEVLLGRAFDADAKEADTFAKLARYETRLERSLVRNRNELQQLQDKRRNPRSSPISGAVTLDATDTP